MSDTSSRQSKSKTKQKSSDLVELERSSVKDTLSSFSTDTLRKSGQAFTEIGKGMFEQLMGLSEQAEKQQKMEKKQETELPKKLERRSLFNFTEMMERRQIQEIQTLLKQVRQEVDAIKSADAAMMNEVKDIDNMTLLSLSERPGIYHVRILEVFVKLLRSIRVKISESSMWLRVARGKQSGGNLFKARSSKMGGNYANSAEHSIARSTQ